MKKILFLLIGLACLTACSDDVVESVSSSSTRMDADMVYLTVKIIDVGSLTRAENGGYQNGTEAEYAVDNAYFYFYDEDGLFVSRAEVWDGGNETTQDGTNVEFEGNTVVVLKGLTEVGFPKYMVTVLNRPDDFEDAGDYEPAATLDEMQTKLSQADDVGIYDGVGNFVMSTSSYNGGDAETRLVDETPYYFVTPIEEANFSLEPIDAENETTPVQVYVERLAAKVEVDVSNDLSATATTITDEDGDTHLAYLLEEYIIDSESTGSDENIYIEFQGWALNATARYSNIVKDITSFDPTSPTGIDGWTTWNDASDFRSYWGASFNYGIDGNYPTTNINPNITYPEGQEANYDENESSNDPTEWLNPYLKYTSLLEDNLHPLVASQTAPYNYDYCAENTNTVGDNGILQSSYSSAITSVLLKARGWQVDENNVASPITLIRYMGDLYTESAFLGYVAQELDIYDEYYEGLHYSEVALEANTTSTDVTLPQFDAQFLTTTNEGNGYIGIALNEEAMANYYWYWLTEEGTYAQIGTAIGGDDALIAALEGEIDRFNEDYANTINEYADGLMYYNIPIEHLNESNKTDGVYDGLLEANYGVVRNHWYSLTINSLSRLGRGIVDETEVIIPTIDDTNYLRASVSILPWKLIENTVIF